MPAERNAEFPDNDGPLSMYDDPLGEIPPVPIGQFAHVDGNGHKRPDGEVREIKELASEVEAEVTDSPIGEHNSTVIRHKAYVWISGAIAVAMGLTTAGIGTAFAIEHHRRKLRK